MAGLVPATQTHLMAPGIRGGSAAISYPRSAFLGRPPRVAPLRGPPEGRLPGPAMTSMGE
jgi:hypothetical protein